MRLKVLIVPEWYPSSDRPGAAPWAREQARAVAPFHDVVVLATRAVDADLVPLFAITEDIEDGMRTLRVAYRETGRFRTSYPIRLAGLRAAFRYLERSGFIPDVIHAHVFWSGFPCLVFARRHQIPLVVSEHYTHFPRGLVTGLGRAVAKATFERAALVCPDSEDLGRRIRALGIGGRYRHIPNVVDTSAFRPPDCAGRNHDGPVRIVNVASLHDKKGHHFLLEALVAVRRQRKDLVLDIIGDGPLRTELEGRARMLGLADVVRFHGPRKKTEVAAAMREADFFVLPSLFENAPHVLIEAMASGLPSVATSVGGVDEMIDSRTGMLVPPRDSATLANAIMEMSDAFKGYDRSELSRLATGRWGHELVGRLWNEAYTEAYWEYTGEPRSRPGQGVGACQVE